MVQKITTSIALILLTLSSSLLLGGQFLDEEGCLQGTIQENGKNGYILLDKNGHTEAYIQENGKNGYMILDSEGKAKGYYQED